MISRPQISIVTPSLNQGAFIEAAIKSVCEQNLDDYEHIVIDGCSSDQTIDILQKYRHLKWISEPDQGQADALNKGFKRCEGEIIGWLNADDRYLPGCFSFIAEFFKRNADVDIVYGDYRWIDELGKAKQLRREIDYNLFILKYLHVLYIPTAATFFRRRIFDEQNYLDTGYHFAMDYEYFLRLALQGYKIAHVKRILADYRWHAQCKSRLEPEKQFMEQVKALYELDPFLLKVSGKKIRQLLRLVLMIFARIKRTFLKTKQRCYW